MLITASVFAIALVHESEKNEEKGLTVRYSFYVNIMHLIDVFIQRGLQYIQGLGFIVCSMEIEWMTLMSQVPWLINWATVILGW